MDSINKKKIHESVGTIIKPQLSKSFIIGNEYKNKILFNQVGDKNWTNMKIDKSKKKNELSEEEMLNLFYKTNLNISDSSEKFIEKLLIKNKDYKNLMGIYENKYPFSLLPKFQLYVYCRQLCNKKLNKKDYNKIKSDLNFLENKTEDICDKQMKIYKGKAEIKF